MTYKRGDVILVYYPNSDLITYKKRPVLIVQADDVKTKLTQKLVAMITSNLSRVGETRVTVLKDSDLGKAMGIRIDSVVVADNLATVEDEIIDKKIGHCSDIEAVNTALKKALGL
ncbi:type II toxin-antitoxin system PemK/MazF family toxin [Trichocoleus sp. DQ-U1]|uniref:type II toxin-antitoxin system PemK/MazF family toxin n=1 Tax=Trichocoleus sp. DQ-U1 TaxID=2933926 RepID=UPI003297B8F7